jgi:hypothetical protein
LQLINDLFQESEQLKFWLRMSFFPPAHLVDAIEIEVIDIENKVQALLEGRFREWIDADFIAADSARTATLAFSGIVDSIMLELVYGNNQKRLKDKLEASWKVFWRGISHR